MKGYLASFGYAIEGIGTFFTERNAQIQLVLLLLAIAAGWWFKLSSYEWIAVTICGGVVLVLEMVNSALESFLDFLHPEKHPLIKRVKDIIAGAVLVASMMALIVAAIVFIPYFTALFAQ